MAGPESRERGRPSLEHLARCFLEGTTPDNADGRAGALSACLALALLESLDTGQAVEFRP